MTSNGTDRQIDDAADAANPGRLAPAAVAPALPAAPVSRPELPSAPGRRLFVCALDWGLGHATRMIPLIARWRDEGCAIVLGSNGRALDLWRREFPALQSIELPDYAIRYAPGPLLVPRLIASLPRVLAAIAAEREATEALARDHGFDAIVSDNRYGCHVRGTPSILVTHQVALAAPPALAVAEPFAELLMTRLLRPFDQVWVPDSPASPGLSGKLGHPRVVLDRFRPALRWIGPLSRLRRPASVLPRWRSVSIVSGPEPARTRFERLLLAQLPRVPGEHLVVLGRPEESREERSGQITTVSHLGAADLAHACCAADVVVSRGGYSTLMDLCALGCRALFVPTSGQTEQEYLARALAVRGMALAIDERRLELVHDIPRACRLPPLAPPPDGREWPEAKSAGQADIHRVED